MPPPPSLVREAKAAAEAALPQVRSAVEAVFAAIPKASRPGVSPEVLDKLMDLWDAAVPHLRDLSPAGRPAAFVQLLDNLAGLPPATRATRLTTLLEQIHSLRPHDEDRPAPRNIAHEQDTQRAITLAQVCMFDLPRELRPQPMAALIERINLLPPRMAVNYLEPSHRWVSELPIELRAEPLAALGFCLYTVFSKELSPHVHQLLLAQASERPLHGILLDGDGSSFIREKRTTACEAGLSLVQDQPRKCRVEALTNILMALLMNAPKGKQADAEYQRGMSLIKDLPLEHRFHSMSILLLVRFNHSKSSFDSAFDDALHQVGLPPRDQCAELVGPVLNASTKDFLKSGNSEPFRDRLWEEMEGFTKGSRPH